MRKAKDETVRRLEKGEEQKSKQKTHKHLFHASMKQDVDGFLYLFVLACLSAAPLPRLHHKRTICKNRAELYGSF